MDARVPTSVANLPPGWPRITPHLIYEDVARATDWLCRAFGFTECMSARHSAADGSVERARLRVDDSVLTLGLPSIHGQNPTYGVSTMLKIYVADVDAHYVRAKSAGAVIVLGLTDESWGDRRYQATDPEGHQWLVAQHMRDVAPEVYLEQLQLEPNHSTS